MVWPVYISSRAPWCIQRGRWDLVAAAEEERRARTQGSGGLDDTAVGAEVAIALGVALKLERRVAGPFAARLGRTGAVTRVRCPRHSIRFPRAVQRSGRRRETVAFHRGQRKTVEPAPEVVGGERGKMALLQARGHFTSRLGRQSAAGKHAGENQSARHGRDRRSEQPPVPTACRLHRHLDRRWLRRSNMSTVSVPPPPSPVNKQVTA